MKKFLLLLLSATLLAQFANAQATKSYPFSVGRSTSCGSGGSAQIQFYNYAVGTKTIQNATGGMVNSCIPQLKIGVPNTSKFTSSLASVSFNPKDHNIYYFWTTYSPSTRTYAWRWPIGTCPTTTSPRLDTIASFAYDILGVAFDNNGNAYMLDFTTEPAGQPHKGTIRSLNFTTGAIGIADTLAVTGGATIYQTGSGDVAMSPSGQMFFVVDNKLFTPNYSAYTGTGASLTCTYVDTVTISTAGYFVGLTYADGENIAAFSGGGCPYYQINPLTAAVSNVTKNNTPTTVYATSDFATIQSGIGAAKKLVSVTPTGTPNQYNVVYDIVVKNFGNMDVAGVQVKDTLSLINGFANVSNISVSIPVNPNGYTVNPLYTGIGPLATNYNLLSGSPTLPNYPVANSSFTIRISCRLSNILPGVVYNNQASVTATDYNSNALTDRSTNGDKPDLNTNDKPDDVGEDQPTPLLISVVAQTPPCTSLTKVLFTQDFGSGTGLSNSLPSPVASGGATGLTNTTIYTPSNTAPLAIDNTTFTNNANSANTANFVSLTDHTGNANGRMMVINADASNKIMYRGTFNAGLCSNQQYSLSFYAAFLANGSYNTVCDGFGGTKYSKIRMRIKDGGSGLIITETSTADINLTSWQQFGLKFVSPGTYTSIIFELLNDAPGGCGNDLAIDDIQFGSCDALPVVSAAAASAGCLGSSTTFTSSLSDPGALPGGKEYKWQVGTTSTGPWADIAGATTSNYTIASVAAGDVGKYYRIIIAATGNMGTPSCEYPSPGILLSAKTLSVAATSATRTKNNICPGIAVNLGITGGTLGTNASWKWYSGASCGATALGTGASITVSPSVTTVYYVRAEGDCNTTACQTVTVTVNCNVDKDRDGIPDWVESNMSAAFADANSNSIINAYDPTYTGFVDNNNDYINDNFQADGDSDNDGIPNYLDTDFPGRVDSNADGVDDRFDADLDGIINMIDLDSDNDGIPDVVEAYGVDANGDGKIDNFVDTDGDGLSDYVDTRINLTNGAYNTGYGLNLPDFDGDGIPNFLDLDSDNDGIPDLVEAGAPDTNNNGRVDGFTDVNGDGLHDSYINAGALLQTGADTNSDGKADSYPNKNKDNDFRPNAYDMDSDGDGIIDVIEAGFSDTNLDGIVDGARVNGWSTTVSGLAALNLRNSDGDSYPDYLDIDSDNDGIPDNIEGQPTAGYKFPGTADTDGDGLLNAYDNTVGFGGMGIFPNDHDGDNIPDYRDLDTDADGVSDIIEGNDFNLNGFADDLVTLTGLDTDGDGLDNRFDSLNSVTNLKGTSYMMGTSGSTTGDATPGTRSPVQKKFPAQIDRDWRYVGVVLPVEILSFTGTLQGSSVNLSWQAIATKEVSKFEIERSLDNTSYTSIGQVTDAVKLNEQQNFGYFDNISGISNDIIYYRLKVIGKAGEIKYSNVLIIRLSQVKTAVAVMPNPAHSVATVKFISERESEVTIRLIDNIGKVVLQHTQRATKGENKMVLTGLSKFGAGVYTLQLRVNDEIVTQKLILN